MNANEFHAAITHEIQEMDFIIRANGWKEGWKQVIWSSVLEGVSLFLVGWSAYLYFGFAGGEWILVWIILGIFPLVGNLVYHSWKYEWHTQQLERGCPDSLLLFAALPASQSFARKIESLSTYTFPPIQKEWEHVHARIQKGASIPDALRGFGFKRNSKTLEGVQRLFLRVYESGSPSPDAAVGMAQDLLLSQSLVEERRATMLVEKYTLLFGGGILVPTLLGVLVGIVLRLPLSVAGETNTLLPHAVGSIAVYLFEYALLSSAFLGIQEGKTQGVWVYALILLPLTQIAYGLGQWYASA